MIVELSAEAGDAAIDAVRMRVEETGGRTCVTRSAASVAIACTGVNGAVAHTIADLPGVRTVRVGGPAHVLAGRGFRATPTIVRTGDDSRTWIGGADFVVIAGPCSVEGRDMLLTTAACVRAAGGALLRGGAFKPRTSPYAFQGLGEEALRMLAEARMKTGLPVVSEVLDVRQLDSVAAHVDVLQIGARNMQNFSLLAEAGRIQRPILLKRGPSATISELLGAAEYILAHGNGDVILCERGIRSFDTATRNTLDIAAIPVLKRETHLPVIVDPSHAAGRADIVTALSLSAAAAGADGLIIEVHPDPASALSDGPQSLTPETFRTLMNALQPVLRAVGRRMLPAAGHGEDGPAGQRSGMEAAA